MVRGKHAMMDNTAQSIGARGWTGLDRDGRGSLNNHQDMAVGTYPAPTYTGWDNPVQPALSSTTHKRAQRGRPRPSVNK